MDKELQEELEQKLCNLCCDNCDFCVFNFKSEEISCVEYADRTKCSLVNRFKKKAIGIIQWLISKI